MFTLCFLGHPNSSPSLPVHWPPKQPTVFDSPLSKMVIIYSVNLEHIGYVYTNLAGLSGVIITDKEYPQRVAFALINRVLEEFSAIHSREQWLSCSGQLEFPQLARMLQQFQNPQQADSIMRVQREIDETKVILHSTINSLLERGEKLEDLVARSDQLGAQSRAFFKSAKKTSSCCVIQ